MFSHLLSDVRFTFRLFRRSPGFIATLLSVLVVGIGATTAMFSLVLALFIRPLPFERADELVMVGTVQPNTHARNVSYPDFHDWKARSRTVPEMAAFENAGFSLASAGEKPEFISGACVAGEFFSLLRLHAVRGRLLGPEDDRLDGPRVAVISTSLWKRRFASDPNILSQTIRLDDHPYTIVGVVQDGFHFPGYNREGSDVWLPVAVARPDYRARTSPDGRGDRSALVVGRRAPGVTLEQANAELDAIAKALATEYPDYDGGLGIYARDLRSTIVEGNTSSVWILFAAVALVFLVICANVANLLLARVAGRRAEMAVRAALGATKQRLMMQLVTETVVIFALGGLGGAALSYVLVDVFVSGVVTGAALQLDIRIDNAVLAFAAGIAIVCGLVFGLVPAVELGATRPMVALKDAAARASLGRSARLVRGGLVIAQVALAFTLLVGSGLTLRAFDRLRSTSPGFDPENVVTAWILFPQDRYASKEKLFSLHHDLLDRIGAYPGVESVATNTSSPMGSSNWTGGFEIEGREPWPVGNAPIMHRSVVSAGYFDTLRIPVLTGRAFDDTRDTWTAERVAVISLESRKRFFPDEDPIGKRLRLGDGTGSFHWHRIIGVVGDVRRAGLSAPVYPEVFMPSAQTPLWFITVLARTSQPESLTRDLPGIVASIDPSQAIAERRLMSARVAHSIGPQRFVASLLGAFAAAALLLATLGIFGLVSYTTSQRTRELGIRIALGASPERVIRVVMSEGVRLLAIGLALGGVGAIYVGRAIAARVDAASAFDPTVFGVIGGALLVTGLLAALFPALRAIRISPAAALRYE